MSRFVIQYGPRGHWYLYRLTPPPVRLILATRIRILARIMQLILGGYCNLSIIVIVSLQVTNLFYIGGIENMKLEHYHSDWNGLKTERNHRLPTEREIATAQGMTPKGLVTGDNLTVFAWETGAEVRVKTGDFALNTYRDLYHIIP